jgi:hypothetical protein
MMNLINNSRGSVGLLAIMAMLFLGIIGGAYATLSTSNVTTAARTRDDIAAQYLAEAGAQWAIAQLTANINYATAGYTSPIKNAGTPTAGTYTVTVVQNGSAITITSVGRVNNAVSRTVLLQAQHGSSGNPSGLTDKDLAPLKYAVFSKKTMTLNHGKVITNDVDKSTGRKLADIRTNNILNIYSSSPQVQVQGDAYCNTLGAGLNDPWWSTKSAVDDGINDGEDIHINSDNIILDINKFMLSMPSESFQKTGTNLIDTWKNGANGGSGEWSNDTYTLASGSYYYNGSYGMYNHSYSIPAGQSVVLYIDGSFQTGKPIIGDDITIYSKGDVTLNGGAIIGSSTAKIKIYAEGTITLNNAEINGTDVTLSANNGNITLNSGKIMTAANAADAKIQLYANGTVALNSNSSITGGNVTVLANKGNMNFNGGTINSTLEKSVTKIYVRGDAALNDVSLIAGKGAGMLVATGSIGLNGGNAPQTLFICDGDIAGNSSTVGGVYANGIFNMNGLTVQYSSNALSSLGLTADSASSPLVIQSWTNKK